jgi:hypothetical protein
MKEVWCFADWNKLDTKEKRTIKASRFTDVVLGITIGRTKWRRSMSDQQVIDNARWLIDNGMRVHIMVWLSRDAAFIRALITDIKNLIDKCLDNAITITSIIYDAEREWHNGKYNVDRAIDLLESALHTYIRVCSNILIGVTGLADLHKHVAKLLAVCDYGIPQAYACWFPPSVTKGKKHWSHSLSTEPRRIQREAHRTWGKYDAPLVMGLANYYLTRPPRFGLPRMSAQENLEACADETLRLGYNRVAYWSLNSAHKKKIIEFFSTLRESDEYYAALDTIKFESAQWLLIEIGNYDLGTSGPNNDGVDGIWGPKSQEALTIFRDWRHSERHVRQGPLCLNDMLELVDTYRQMQIARTLQSNR